ncbi:hypothetical protein RUM44_005431 [Polyplax serrata]|uniref:Uncharacterized protein n=1 Tax=Polyplax serrata TaxID=468196 RepID=A0ABR1AXY4_POLSC
MTILGRGSMRDKRKEDELRLSGDPKFSHLHDDLHIEISAFAPPAEAHARIAFALTDIRPFLVPDCNDDIRQEQMWEMEILKEHSETQNIIGRTVGLDILDTTGLGSPGISNTSSSHTRQSPPRAPSKVLNRDNLPHQHQTVHSFTFLGSNVAGTVLGKKRPFLSASNRHLHPVKRTIMSILTRKRMTQLNRRFSLANRVDDHDIP